MYRGEFLQATVIYTLTDRHRGTRGGGGGRKVQKSFVEAHGDGSTGSPLLLWCGTGNGHKRGTHTGTEEEENTGLEWEKELGERGTKSPLTVHESGHLVSFAFSPQKYPAIHLSKHPATTRCRISSVIGGKGGSTGIGGVEGG